MYAVAGEATQSKRVWLPYPRDIFLKEKFAFCGYKCTGSQTGKQIICKSLLSISPIIAYNSKKNSKLQCRDRH